MATELAKRDGGELATADAHEGQVVQFDEGKLDLLKRTICNGATDEEFELFVHACKRMRLDPFMRQIHAVKRWDGQQRREVMSIQTGIDGYRLIAERTGKYMPGPKPTYEYGDDGEVTCATAYVKKLGPDGQWHTVDADAFFDEYAGFTKDGKPNRMWAEKPHIMLSKCAEALALRRAFPAELSGVYTAEEMDQANGSDQRPAGPKPSDDDLFLGAWTEALVGHGFTAEQARKVLDDSLAAKSQTLADMHRKHRVAAIQKARQGGYNDRHPDAVAGDAPLTWETANSDAAGLAGANGVSGEQYEQAAAKYAAAAGHADDPDQLTPQQCQAWLDAVRDDRVDWTTGSIKPQAKKGARPPAAAAA